MLAFCSDLREKSQLFGPLYMEIELASGKWRCKLNAKEVLVSTFTDVAAVQVASSLA